jgi:hypothetical protein
MANDPSPWLEVFGRAHPVLLHSPIGILPAIAVLEFGAVLLRKAPPRGAILTLAWLAGLSGALAAASGWVLAGSGDYGGSTLTLHQWTGVALAVLSILAAILAGFTARAPFRLCLLAALGVLVPAGHFGGTITHGKDFLFAPLHRAAANQASANQATANQASATGATAPALPTDAPPAGSQYQRLIVPLLERTCTSCHNPDKTKGELLLTTTEGILRGGENGPVVVPGKPAESPLLTRCLLPLDDDEHMPPEEKPQPTADELESLRAWIAAGAKFD